MLLMAQDCKLIHLGSIPHIKCEYHHVLCRSERRFYSSAFTKHFEIPRKNIVAKQKLLCVILLCKLFYRAKQQFNKNTVPYSHKVSENWQVFSYINIKSQITKK